jgi:hypothetical protein
LEEPGIDEKIIFCVYGFRTILSVKSNYFPKRNGLLS